MPVSELKKWQDMRLAERAVQMLHSANARKIVNRLILKTQNGTLGESDPEADKFLGENMQVRVGNEIHNYPEPVAPSPASGAVSLAKKATLVAALLAAGGGAGAGIPWIAGAFDKPDAPATLDTDTRYELRIGGGE